MIKAGIAVPVAMLAVGISLPAASATVWRDVTDSYPSYFNNGDEKRSFTHSIDGSTYFGDAKSYSNTTGNNQLRTSPLRWTIDLTVDDIGSAPFAVVNFTDTLKGQVRSKRIGDLSSHAAASFDALLQYEVISSAVWRKHPKSTLLELSGESKDGVFLTSSQHNDVWQPVPGPFVYPQDTIEIAPGDILRITGQMDTKAQTELLGDLHAESDFVTNSGGLSFSAFMRPIPEPGTYALMACGLSVLAGVARRSSRRTRAS